MIPANTYVDTYMQRRSLFKEFLLVRRCIQSRGESIHGRVDLGVALSPADRQRKSRSRCVCTLQVIVAEVSRMQIFVE